MDPNIQVAIINALRKQGAELLKEIDVLEFRIETLENRLEQDHINWCIERDDLVECTRRLAIKLRELTDVRKTD